MQSLPPPTSTSSTPSPASQDFAHSSPRTPSKSPHSPATPVASPATPNSLKAESAGHQQQLSPGSSVLASPPPSSDKQLTSAEMQRRKINAASEYYKKMKADAFKKEQERILEQEKRQRAFEEEQMKILEKKKREEASKDEAAKPDQGDAVAVDPKESAKNEARTAEQPREEEQPVSSPIVPSPSKSTSSEPILSSDVPYGQRGQPCDPREYQPQNRPNQHHHEMPSRAPAHYSGRQHPQPFMDRSYGT